MIDIEKARALVERLRVVPFIDDECPHCVADTIDALIAEVERLNAQLVSFSRGVKIRIPTATMEQEFARHYDSGYQAGKAEREALAEQINVLMAMQRGDAEMISELRAERDALARDAARYRWLRAHPLDGTEEDTPCIRAADNDKTHWALNGEAADAAIDAAMKGASDE